MLFKLLCGFGLLACVTGHQCPTWFHVPPGATNNTSCECGSRLSGEIQCDNRTEEVSLVLGYCMTFSNVSGKELLVMGYTNKASLKGSVNRVYARLPHNVSALDEFMCKNNSRRGFLCGDCISGHGYAINSIYNMCVKCSTAYAVGMLLLCTILPMTLCYVLIIVFRLNIPSGSLCGYIIFCQCTILFVRSNSAVYYSMLGSMGRFGQTTWHISLSVAGLSWNFVGVFFLLEPTCIHHKLSRLQVLCIEYIYFLYPVLLLLLTFICIELHARNCKLIVLALKPFRHCVQRNWNFSISDSVIQAYATFFFLSIMTLAFQSLNTLYSSHVYDINYRVIKTVLVYEPTIEWFSSYHILYAIPAIVMLFLFGVCPTLLLCLHTTNLLRKCCTLRPRAQLMLKTFGDTFEGCYKDGLNQTYDFRFLSSFPMVMAFSFLLLFLFSTGRKVEHRLYFYAIASLFFLITSVFFAFCKPYKTLYMNFSLCFHSAIAAIIMVILTLWYEGHIMSSEALASAFTFFITLPHLFATITVAYHCLCYIPFIKKRMDMAFRVLLSLWHCRLPKEDEMTSSSSSLLPDRLVNSYAYRN